MREATARHAARAQREIDAAANRAKASAPPCRNEVLFPSRAKIADFASRCDAARPYLLPLALPLCYCRPEKLVSLGSSMSDNVLSGTLDWALRKLRQNRVARRFLPTAVRGPLRRGEALSAPACPTALLLSPRKARVARLQHVG